MPIRKQYEWQNANWYWLGHGSAINRYLIITGYSQIPLIILNLFDFFTGQPNIIYYAADVFKTVGFCSEFSSTLASVGLGIMKVVSTAISLSIVDKVGRKKALISGIAVMGFAVLVLGIFASVDNSEVSGKPCTEYTNHLVKHNLTNNNNTNVTEKDLNQIVVIANSEEINTCPEATTSKSFRIIAFLALVTYVCAYSFGFGPITWILLSEIFPPSVKGRAMATVTSINWALNFGVSATFVEISGKEFQNVPK